MAGVVFSVLSAWPTAFAAATVPARDGERIAAPGWIEAMGLQAMLGDTINANARIYDSPDYQQQLVLTESAESVFLLDLKGQTVLRLEPAAVHWTSDGLPVPDPSQAVATGTFTTLAGEILFEMEDQHWSVRPEPPLIGPLDARAFAKAKPDYFRLAGKYDPDPESIRALQEVGTETRVAVFFGTWCALCKRYVPQLLRTLELVNNPKISVEYYGVSEDQLEPKAELQRLRVSATPSFVVLQGGKEVGRITEEPDRALEKDLALILTGR